MIEELKKLRSKIKIGIVGGSDMSKQYEQLGKTGKLENLTLFLASFNFQTRKYLS